MKALRRFLSRLAASATARRDEARLREEFEAHLQMQAAEYVRAGMPPEEARRQAVLKFGPIEATKFGLPGSFGFAGVTRTLVFGVSPGDAATFASMTALLVLTSLLAFVIPVRAATRLDALAAIRHE